MHTTTTVLSMKHPGEAEARGDLTEWVLALYEVLSDAQKDAVREAVRRRARTRRDG